MNGILSDIFYTVFNLSLIGALMIAGIFLIRGVCYKKRLLKSSFFVFLWMAILFRMLVPLSIPMPSEYQVFGSIAAGWPAAEQQLPPGQIAPEQSNIGNQGAEDVTGRFAGMNRPGVQGKPDITRNEENAAGNADGIGWAGAETGSANEHRSITIYDILPVAWLAGTALMAAAFLGIWLATASREKHTAAFQYGGWQEIKTNSGVTREIALKIRKADLKAEKETASAEGLHPRSPYVSGVFHPTIILPARLQSCQNEHMDHILLHELTHIRHWDNLKKVIAAAALCLHWFNPAFWLCWIFFQRDLECSCDEKVVALLGEQEKKHYAESLYEFACESQNVLLCHFSSSGRTAVYGRIKRILADSPKPSFAGAAAFGLALLLLITGCAADPLPKAAEEPPAESVLVYAAPDGLYRTALTGSGAEKIFEGTGFNHPVFSENGDMVMFRRDAAAAPSQRDSSLQDEKSLYVYHLGLGKGISLDQVPASSYCAGPDNTFFIASDGEGLVKAEFQITQRDGADTLEYRTEDISARPEWAEQARNISISYGNLSCSPDYKYLAYNVSVSEYRDPSEGDPGNSMTGEGSPENDMTGNSGGLYVMNLETGETATAAENHRPDDTDGQGYRLHPVSGEVRTDPMEGLGNYSVPGPWSRDGKTLWVWNLTISGSINADGVSGFFYHADTGEKTEYGLKAASYTENHKTVLGYDQNISFSEAGTAAVLTGAGREMFYNKKIDLITDYSGAPAAFQEVKSISENGLIPAMPQLSADGKTLYFAAINEEDVKGYEEGTWTAEEYQNIWPLKRQLYSVALEDAEGIKAGEIIRITSDPNYRNENPVLLKDESRLVFGRANAEVYDGKMEIWMADLGSGGEVKLAEWTEPDDADVWATGRYDDYYGRGSWNGIFAIYDATK